MGDFTMYAVDILPNWVGAVYISPDGVDITNYRCYNFISSAIA